MWDTVVSDIFIKKTNENTELMITVSDYQLKQRTSLFDGTLEMDAFELKMSFNHSRTYMHTYDAFFKTKSTFKEVILHVPDRVLGGERPIEDEVAQNHTSVEKLKIISAAFATVESLIERCSVAFPNLKILILDRFFGRWLKDVPKYKLELGKYTLEKLVLYLTPLYLENQKRKAVVIDIEVLCLGDRHLYKLPVDSSEPTRIDNQDMIGGVRGEDYVLVHLVVGSLRYLNIVSEVNTRPGMRLETKLDIELQSSKSSNDE